MNSVECRRLAGETLTMLAGGLRSVVVQVLNRSQPPGADCADVPNSKDAANGRRVGEYRSRELAVMLRAMTERPDDLGYVVSKAIPR